MSKKRMPGRWWAEGVKGWEKSMASYIALLEKSLAEELTNTESDRPSLRAMVGAEDRLYRGLFYWWQEQEDAARQLFAESAALTETLVERWPPAVAAGNATNYARPVELGAMAASLAGQEQVARKLFSHAELFATGLVGDDGSIPADPFRALNKANVIRPYTRAYSLIRLGRLSGFKSFIYTVPLAQARKATPVWKSTDLHELLDTANLCFELWRSERGGLDSLKKKKFEPLLRALVACLSPSAGEPERAAARKALKEYEQGMHDMHYFLQIYPRVLDLRAAYPQLFG
jgi:hypothetical protein